MALSLGKNIGKLKQWTSEKIGSVEKTDTSDDFKQLEIETEQRRESLEKLEATMDVYLKALSKRKATAEDKNKSMPIEALGTCMINQAYIIGEDSPYGKSLFKVGQAHEKISGIQADFVAKSRMGYYANLERSLSDMKDFQKLKIKLENRRLDLDAKLSRVQKAKKEKPELEEEMRAAQVKYEDTLADTHARMVIIAEAEEFHARDLALFVESELAYYNKSAEILLPVLNALKEINSAPKPKKATPSNPRQPQLARSMTYSEGRRSDYESDDYTSRSMGEPDANDTFESNHRAPLAAASSLRKKSASSLRSNQSDRAPPPIPRRTAPKKQVKCVFDFETDAPDELNMKVGDIITVTKEIDEGWWIGEISLGRETVSGMFPANYTEAYEAPEPKITQCRSFSSSHSNEDPWGTNGRVANYHTDEPEEFEESYEPPRPPFRRSNTSSSNGSAKYNSAPTVSSGPALPSRDNDNTTSNTPPRAIPSSATRRAGSPVSGSQGVPPPRPSGPKPGTSAPSKPSPLASSSPKKSYLGASGPSAVASSEGPSTAVDCQECGCNDFSPNVFKKGVCNNCFHKH